MHDDGISLLSTKTSYASIPQTYASFPRSGNHTKLPITRGSQEIPELQCDRMVSLQSVSHLYGYPNQHLLRCHHNQNTSFRFCPIRVHGTSMNTSLSGTECSYAGSTLIEPAYARKAQTFTLGRYLICANAVSSSSNKVC